MSFACHVQHALFVLELSRIVATAFAGTACWTGLGLQLMLGGPAYWCNQNAMVLKASGSSGKIVASVFTGMHSALHMR